VAASLEEALARVSLPPPAFCIGGAVLYRDAIERADTMHLTEIDREFPGDVRFPPFDRGAWLRLRVRHLRAAIARARVIAAPARVRPANLR